MGNCLVYWIIGFVVGSWIGAQSDLFVSLLAPTGTLAFICLLFLIFRMRYARILSFLGALAWGLCHGAPSPQYPLESVRIERKNLVPFGVGLIVTEPKAGNSFYVTGTGPKNQVGHVLRSANSSLYFTRPGLFKARLVKEGPRYWFDALHSLIDRRVSQLPLEIRGFVYSIVLGEKHHLGMDLNDAFKKLGLFHLLVVSGLHVSVLSALVLWMVFVPFQCCYAACFFNAGVWYKLRFLLVAFSISVVCSYALAIGFSPSIQRAVLLFVADQTSRIFSFSVSRLKRILATLALQILFFPLDFLSLSSILSWITYLTVLGFVYTKAKGWKATLYCQSILCLFIAGLLGQVSIIGFLLNSVVVPLFPFIVFVCVLPLFPELISGKLSVLCCRLGTYFLRGMERLSDWTENVSGLYFEITDLRILRNGCLALGAVLLIRLLGSSRDEVRPKS